MKKVCDASAFIVAVIVTYNRKELLSQSLLAIKNQTYKNLTIVVVDNDSTDGTYEKIKELLDEKTLYFKMKENLGGAGGYNFGIKKACELNADYVWLMDDDSIAFPNALQVFVDRANELKGDFGFLSGKVLFTDGTDAKMNTQRRGFFDKSFNTAMDSQRIILASFVSLFINVQAVKSVGNVIKDFFIWADDWEYTYRISKRYKCYYVSGSVAVHKLNSNIGVNIFNDSRERLDRYYYAYRNEKYFFNRTDSVGRLYFFLKILYHKLKLFFSRDKRKKEKKQIMKKGLKDARRFNPQIENI